jgi:hypothetical protein
MEVGTVRGGRCNTPLSPIGLVVVVQCGMAWQRYFERNKAQKYFEKKINRQHLEI